MSSLQRKNWSASLSNEAKPRPKSEFWKIRRDLDFGGGGGNDLGGAVAANARSVAGVFLTLGYCEGNEFKAYLFQMIHLRRFFLEKETYILCSLDNITCNVCEI